jgi:hypothetical protein
LSKKNLPIIFFTFLFIFISCTSEKPIYHPPKHVLEKHLEFSKYTNPGEYDNLYDDLPESLDDLCTLIKKQLVHPFKLKKYSKKIPKDRVFEDRDFPTVSLMLSELLKRDESGLVFSRQPENRLVVACVHHCMLLASILRHRNVPVRIRAGYAKYIGDNNIRVSHVVCEVWDRKYGKWILVDPDRQRIDFPRWEFEFAYDTWNLLRSKDLHDKQFVSRYADVDLSTVHLLCHDLSYVIGTEELYWNDPPIVAKSQSGIANLPKDELQLLDKIAIFLKESDFHLAELADIQKQTLFLQYDK